MFGSPSREGGFTLLEAVVAMTIVGAASVAVLSAFGGELRAAERARSALEAEALAGDRLALLRLQPRDQLAALPDSVRRGRFGAPLDRYSWEAEVRQAPGTPGLYDASVTITWTGGAYALRSRLYRPAPLRVAP